MSLHAFSDEELLAIIQERGDKDGWVTTAELSSSIGIPVEEGLSATGVRLGWMARYGVVLRDSDRRAETRWRLTKRGTQVVNASFTKSMETSLNGLGQDALWRLARAVTDRYGGADDVSANLVRRSFLRAERRRRYR
jgi:hypothetical protein